MLGCDNVYAVENPFEILVWSVGISSVYIVFTHVMIPAAISWLRKR